MVSVCLCVCVCVIVFVCVWFVWWAVSECGGCDWSVSGLCVGEFKHASSKSSDIVDILYSLV